MEQTLREMRKNYYQKNKAYFIEYRNRPEVKERIKEYHNRLYFCNTCEEEIRVVYKKKHEETQKHISFLNEQ